MTVTHSNLSELSESFNHFLPYILRKLEEDGALKYQGSNLKNSKIPFGNEPKVDFEELKKYQVVFVGKEDGFFSKAWKKWWSKDDEGDRTYRIKVVKILTDEVYENED